MTYHHLKIESHWHTLLMDGIKTHEVRYADRDYQAGDRIYFNVGTREIATYDAWIITHVLHHHTGVADGYVILSLQHPYKTLREREYEARECENTSLRRSNAALRGVITRLRNQISMREHREMVGR